MEAKKVLKNYLWGSLLFVCSSLLAILPSTLSADNPPRGWLTKNFTLMTWNINDPPPSLRNLDDRYNFIKYVKDYLKNGEYPLSLVGIQEDFQFQLFNLFYDNNEFKYFVHPTYPDPLNNNISGDGLAIFSDFVISNPVHIPWNSEFNVDYFAEKGFVWSIVSIPIVESNDFIIHFYNLHANSRDCFDCKVARVDQIRQLKSFMQYHSSGMPVVVCGDFNIDGKSTAESGDYYLIEDLMNNQNYKYLIPK